MGLAAAVPTAEAADLVVAGVCKEMSLSVTFSPPLTHEGLPNAQTTITVNGTGQCLMQDAQWHNGTLTGTVRTLPGKEHVTCAGGVIGGTADFYTDYEGFSAGVSQVSMHIVLVAGVATVVITDLLTQETPFVGTGVFFQVPTDTDTCLASSLGSATWWGVFAFGAKGNLVVSVV